MPELSPKEMLERDIAVLGHEYGAAYYHCQQELWRVSSNWDRYETLFGSKERVDILNASSGTFWHVMQSLIHEHVLLGICRLTDPPGSGRRQNLSVDRLLAIDPTDSKAELADRVKVASEKAEFARTWRDKRIAHNDLAHLYGDASLLQPSTSIKVSEAVVAIHSVLRWIQGRYFDGELFLIDIGDSDANELMIALARAKSAWGAEQAYADAGQFDKLFSGYPDMNYGRKDRYSSQSEIQPPEPYPGPLPLMT